MQFSVENTVTFIKKPRLVLEGKWAVTFNGKKYENGDTTICNQKDSVKNLEAAFKIDSVTFNGKEISGYDAKTTLNGNSFDSSCESNELEKRTNLLQLFTMKPITVKNTVRNLYFHSNMLRAMLH